MLRATLAYAGPVMVMGPVPSPSPVARRLSPIVVVVVVVVVVVLVEEAEVELLVVAYVICYMLWLMADSFGCCSLSCSARHSTQHAIVLMS